jgi:YlmC/YmxH family sporulation protein
MVKTSELRLKDVVNIVDGRRLGTIGDFDLDLEAGQIKSFIISGQGRLLGFFGKDRDTLVQWNQVEKIGEDVVLVRIDNYSEAASR